jgi:uncharacterized protein (TIGR00255 family)
MILSMTGFGSSARETDAFRATAMARSLNHRYLEINVNMPRDLTELESEIRALTQARVRRGRVDVTLRTELIDAPGRYRVCRSSIAEYMQAMRAISEEHGLDQTTRAVDLLLLPGVVEPRIDASTASSETRAELLALVREALDALQSMRQAEGTRLKSDFEKHLDAIECSVAALESMSEESKAARRAQLSDKAAALREELGLDEPRLFQEIARLVERSDVNEEIVRLKSHLMQAREALGANASAGRRLDFLAQEMMREVNTIGNKALAAGMIHAVVEIKGQIERMREQAQNVE